MGLGRQRNSSYDMLAFVFMLNNKLITIVPKALKRHIPISDDESRHMLLIRKMDLRYATRHDFQMRVIYRGVYTHYEEEANLLKAAGNWLIRLGAIVNGEEIPQETVWENSTLETRTTLPDYAYEQLAEKLREEISIGQREGQ